MNRVTELRYLRKMTQEAFAEFCDISRISIARYDAGAPISRKNAEKIAKACNVSIDSLLNFNPPKDESDPVSESLALSMTSEEEKLITDYRALSAKGRKRATETLRELSMIYSKKE